MHKDRQFEKSNNFGKAMARLVKELRRFNILIIISIILSVAGSTLEIIAPDEMSKLTDQIAKGLIVNTDNIETINKTITSNLKKSMPSTNTSSKNTKIDTKVLDSLDDNTISIIFPEFTVDKIVISSKDQVKYLKVASKLDENASNEEIYKSMDKMPKSIRKVIEPKMDMKKIKSVALYLLILFSVASLLSFGQSFIMAIVSNKFAQNLRKRISKKINRLPLKYFDNNQVGDILSRVTNDVDTIGQSLNQSLSNMVMSITLLIGSLIMMFKTDSIMALTAIGASILGFAFMGLILSKSQKHFNARQKELGKLNAHIEEIYSGLLVVKAYNAKKISDKKFDEYNEKVKEANRKSQFLSGMMMPLMGFIGNFGYVMVCIVGALLVMKGRISFGVIVAFIVYVRLFSQPLTSIAQAMTNMQSSGAASERVFEFLDEEEMVKEDTNKKLSIKETKGNIEFNNIKFSYDKEKPIIKNFSASVKSGQKIAIVGPTGAGKTTMVNLLMKFYNIDDGDITIDGRSIHELTRENIHSLFTMVLQDTWLFNGTVRENIVFNKKNVSDKDVMNVCDKIGLSHFIKTLPEGLDTMIGDNESVSTGQKQLITIARGMIEDSPLLILDEATSNVDTRTEELVQKAMDKLMQGRTSFIIAHRLSTIKNADLILVMNEGNIIEQGTHDELMKQNGFYAGLYNSQFKL
jgi:ATP-binding cassette subfamily B protein